MNEKQIETEILTWLNYQPHCFAIKINTVGVFDSVRKIYRKNKNPFIHLGTSDIFCFYQGKSIAIEVKTPKTIKTFYSSLEDRERNQREFLEKVRKTGNYALVVSSLDEVISYFNRIKTEVPQLHCF